MIWDILAGTYKGPQSQGIFSFQLDTETGSMTKPRQLSELPNAKYLAAWGEDYVVSAYGDDVQAGVALLKREDGELKLLWQLAQGKIAPCYVVCFGSLLATANYQEGEVYFYRLNEANPAAVPACLSRLAFGEGAGCHQVLENQGYFYVPCLLQDKLRVISPEFEAVAALDFEPGSGPRHGRFSADGRRLWLVGELDNHLYSFDCVSPTELRIRERLPLLADSSQKAGSAALFLSADEHFLYVTTREVNLMSVWELSGAKLRLVQQCSTEGEHPRDFLMTPDGRFILIANRYSNEIVLFQRDAATGRLSGPKGRVQLAEAVTFVIKEA